MARASLRYQGHRDPQEALRMRLRELAASRVRFGYRRLTVLLRRDGWPSQRPLRNAMGVISRWPREVDPPSSIDRY
jgi:hypothetical protein